MKSKLLLTLWLVGAVLYAGSTVFLAHAVLGGLGGSHAPDKLKADAVAAADAHSASKASTSTKFVKVRHSGSSQARRG
jgi:hypothetical protein